MKNENSKCACQGGTLTRFVQPIILFSLAETPDHGYDLLQKIARTDLWHESPPDAAGVYRVLRDMEKRGLICSHIDPDSKAGMGKRVFEITDEGRACMRNWVDTLEQYRRGIDQVIVHLREALADHRAAAAPEPHAETSCCCCGRSAAAEE
ncbi:MAG: helix-turn-helix transcriptional regulator [Butyricicoccus sp.]|nr:helix-turn-helix transcriptional regulator [Butyricicoccus sp.]